MATSPVGLDLWLSPHASFTPNTAYAGRLGKIKLVTEHADVDLLLSSSLTPTTAAALLRRLESAAGELAASYDAQARAAAEATVAGMRGTS